MDIPDNPLFKAVFQESGKPDKSFIFLAQK